MALQLITEDLGHTITQFISLTSSKAINFELLWAIFPSNTYVYDHYNLLEEDRILLCRSFDYTPTEQGYIGSLVCDVVCDNGQSFGVGKVGLKIPSFRDSRRITDLPVYPLNYHHDPKAIRAVAVARGRRFSHVRRQCFETSGHAGLIGHRNTEKVSKANVSPFVILTWMNVTLFSARSAMAV